MMYIFRVYFMVFLGEKGGCIFGYMFIIFRIFGVLSIGFSGGFSYKIVRFSVCLKEWKFNVIFLLILEKDK